jgi:hypothetical protein
MIMTEEELRQILQQIMELAQMLDWQAVISQNADGQLMGMYLGTEEFIRSKRGMASGTFIH